MAISIDWGTRVIYVPKADLTLVQASPEVRELDINAFRLALKDLEDFEEGMPHPNTHTHNTEVELAGLVYARVVEIINGYTVEFEDGQYTVNVTGANHNLSDVKVANQVSLIVNNAAGLISNSAIEYASFNQSVTIDPVNGVSGTLYPTGTLRQPVDNLADAILIAEFRGFSKLLFMESMTLSSGDISGYKIESRNHKVVTLTIDAAVVTDSCIFQECTLEGSLNGSCEIIECDIFDLDIITGEISNSHLHGTLTLTSGQHVILSSCATGDPSVVPVIDMTGSNKSVTVNNFSGSIRIENSTDPANFVAFGFSGGLITLDSTITAGNFILGGVAELVDNSTSVTSLNTNTLIRRDAISDAVWNAVLTDFQDLGSSGEALRHIMGLSGENVQWSNIVYNSDNLMTSARITLYTDNTLTTPEQSWDVTATYNTNGEMTAYNMVIV